MNKEITGNFDTAEKEVYLVEQWLLKQGFKRDEFWCKKYYNADDADVIVQFHKDKSKRLLFEVKEEEPERFKKYGEYGIDYISVCYYKNDISKEKQLSFRHNNKPEKMNEFLSSINKYKDGKIVYSKSDVWLFAIKNGDDYDIRCYNAKRMEKAEFINYLKENSPFSVIHGNVDWNTSKNNYYSACFFVKPELMEVFKMTQKDLEPYRKNN